MKRRIIETADGSKTILIEDWQEQYHSIHGAVQEAYHVFIKQGLYAVEKQEIAILEMGFGTGLNALITYLESKKTQLKIRYYGIEAYPVSQEELAQLNYAAMLKTPGLEDVFKQMHDYPWEEARDLVSNFSLHKKRMNFQDVSESEQYDLIYFDAFGPRVQPELWTLELFQKMYTALLPGGILVTYSAKGSVRRAMEQCGFQVERLAGPPGKREMLRAIKR
ncbi:MAG: tRNA (5-methylaminomethyl-2-thiouridine)(34)-methyltransferase MnmD [Flavobacteriaceae bacterium]|nr:tRNA (5-methylaminomethyl-2-thiouridine)(34)-methyltransferase MnmD [Eudoraea sp.]NNJ38495.1 tRNA (5-methylaminomethyl-2-thiouridine)(34)-methyltransferase MnmD [Flavobacteriaceae bacterium]